MPCMLGRFQRCEFSPGSEPPIDLHATVGRHTLHQAPMHMLIPCDTNIRETESVCCRMAVLNDFEANGYGVTALDGKHVVVLNDVPSTDKVCSPR